MNKRILALALAMVMLFSAVPAAFAYTGVADWAQPEVSAMEELGLIPESLMEADLSRKITRLDMCRIAMLAYTELTGKTVDLPEEHPFSDTTDPDVERAFVVGLTKGDGDGTFRPDDPLRRVEFFCFVGHFLNAVGFEATDNSYAELDSFEDSNTLPDWAEEYTRLTVGLGIVKGDGEALNWESHTTSQEALAMFHRAYITAMPEDIPPEETVPEETEPEEPEITGFINLAVWAEESVTAMDQLGLIPDSVRAQPMDGPITRENMCKVVITAYKRLMGVTDDNLVDPEENPFADTDDADILHAYQLGIVNGHGDGTFGPNDPITRQDFFTISTNFLSAIGYPYCDAPGVDLSEFGDSNQLASYAKPAARLLIRIGAVKGDDKKLLHPTDHIVSQEALCIFYRIHNYYIEWNQNRTEDPSILGQEVADLAMQYLGYPYVYGGKNPEDGFDCSGFVYYIYQQFGYTLYPGALNQWENLPDEIVARDEIMPGDLVFFSTNGDPSGMSHVAICIGNDQMIHAANPDSGVKISSLNESYYVQRYLGVKRVIQ